MSQKSDILTYLEKHGQITPLEALHWFGCFRLSERIRELEAEGVKIKHSRNGKKPNYAIYTLEGK